MSVNTWQAPNTWTLTATFSPYWAYNINTVVAYS